MKKKFYLFILLLSLLTYDRSYGQLMELDSIEVSMLGGKASSQFTLPSTKIVVKSFVGPTTTFQGSNNKNEKGNPFYSKQVESGAIFYEVRVVPNFPENVRGPRINRTGASSFIAVKYDAEGYKKIWMTLSVGAFRIVGSSTQDWEYQFRYFKDTRTGEETASLGTVSNTNTYAGQEVVASVKVYEKNTTLLSLYNEFKIGNQAAPLTRTFLEEINLGINKNINAKTKVCADGSEATVIEVKGKQANDVSIKIENTSIGNEERDGELINPIKQVDKFRITYKHPSFFNSERAQREYLITLLIYQGATQVGKLKLTVVRPPVALIHGLLSKGKIFELMKVGLQAELYSDRQVHIVRYSDRSGMGFWDNSALLQERLKLILLDCNNAQISAGKCDLIGHSMGGILSRIHVQTNYHSAVNRVITLNTPHGGSQVGNLVDHQVFYGALTVASFIMGGEWKFQAIRDLRVGSVALTELLNGPTRTHNSVPCHAIVTRYEIPMDQVDPLSVINDWSALVLQAALFKYKSMLPSPGNDIAILLNRLTQELFDGYNDITVSDQSQRGGLSPSNVTLIPANQNHMGSTVNPIVIEKVKELLKKSPADPLFSKTWYDPFPEKIPDFLSETNKGARGYTAAATQASTLHIAQPLSGTTVRPNQFVTVSVNVSQDIKNIVFFAGNASVGTYQKIVDPTTTTFTYQVPTNAIGTLRLAALGFGEAGYELMDTTVTLQVVPNVNLKSISVQPASVLVSLQGTQQLTVTGLFDDGVERDLSALAGVTYQFKENIASYLGEGQVQGNQMGRDTLTVQYLGSSTRVPIQVYVAIETPLPVTFIHFSGKNKAELGNQLLWSTAQETTNSHFLIERSPNGKQFEVIGLVKGAGTTTTLQGYTFWDRLPCSPITYYRLKQIDEDGTTHDSKMISVKNAGISYDLTIYPNPTEGELAIELSPTLDVAKIQVLNLQGLVLWQKAVFDKKIQVNTLPKGAYILRIFTKTGHTLEQRFIKQ
ncbi:T9SS type A sorting domain-containing protein [Siphonobacter curvatus]|nr:T9SS type A sorting domain-containing protein [Siphonobacter curvatus]